MTVYTILMESFYYDGDDFVIEDVCSEMHNCKDFKTAKDYMERAIAEEIGDGVYTEDQLMRDGDDYAVFVDYPTDDKCTSRNLYRLTIYERELE